MARLLHILLVVCTSILIRNGAFGQDPFQLMVTNSAVDESVGSVQACVQLNSASPLASDTNVNLETMDRSAIGPDDYSILSEELTFNSGSTSATMCRDIQIEQDNLSENIETFAVVLTVDGSSEMVTVLIFDDDDGVIIGLEESVYSVNESVGMATVCAVLRPESVGLGRDVRFNFAAQDGSASSSIPSESDYTFAESEHTFSPTTSRVCRNISIQDDTFVEDTESFTVSLESTNNAMVDGSASVQIIDNDGATVSIQETEISVPEDTIGQICIVLENDGLRRDVSVTLTTTAGTASTNDFILLANEVLTISSTTAVGNSVCSGITVIDDMIVEDSEAFTITVETSNSNDVIMGPNSATVTIPDDDGAILSIQETEISIAEGTIGQICIVLESVGNGLERDISATLNTTSGTAGEEDFDFELIETVSFPSTAVVDDTICRNITAVDDIIPEGNEQFLITVVPVNTNDGVDGPSTATIIIQDGTTVSIQETEISVPEDNIGQICIVLENAADGLARDVSVTLTTTTGTASTNDFSPLANEILTISSTAAIGDSVCLNITVTDDMLVEESETFSITVETSNPNDMIMGTSTATITIIDDDSATISIQETEISIAEGMDGQICIVLENASDGLERDVSVTLTTTTGTAGASDFSPLANEVLTIPSTAAVGNFVCHNISVLDDMIVEDSETYTITVETSNSNDVIMGPSSAAVTIPDDDGAILSIQETEISIAEGTIGQICIVLESVGNGLERGISATLNTTSGTAGEEDFDFELIETVSFPSTAVVDDTICRNITAVDDIIPEGNEQFLITVVPVNTNDGVDGPSTATIIIQDGTTVSIQETEISVPEGNIGQICIVLENAADGLARDVSVTLTTTTGTAGTNDFSPLANEVLTISSTAAVGNSVCLNITITDDMIVEENETFSITVETSNPNDIIMGTSTATITIIDDDSATISIQETEISFAEGMDGQICIVLENASDGLERDVSVTLTTTAGTAGASDFSTLANEILIIPSTTAVNNSVCRNISVIDDMIVEDSETFTITVETSNSNDVIMGPNTATVTIPDDDGATLSIQETLISIPEGISDRICIILESVGNGLERSISVMLNTTSGTAGEEDFELIEIVSFPSTAVVNDIICRDIFAVNEDIREEDEQFLITVVPVNPNDGVDGPSIATITLLDIDCGPLPNPFGGQVTLDGMTFGSQATYTCGDFFMLAGNMTRICEVNEQWSGSEPTCVEIIISEPPALSPSGRTIGIAVGVSVGVTLLILVILIIIVAVYISKRRTRHQKYVLSYTVYDNPQTGGAVATSVDETDGQPVTEQPPDGLEHTEGQPATEQPPDYNDVVGEGDANGSESAVIEPADEKTRTGDEAAGGDETLASEELVDVADKSDLEIEMIEFS